MCFLGTSIPLLGSSDGGRKGTSQGGRNEGQVDRKLECGVMKVMTETGTVGKGRRAGTLKSCRRKREGQGDVLGRHSPPRGSRMMC